MAGNVEPIGNIEPGPATPRGIASHITSAAVFLFLLISIAVRVLVTLEYYPAGRDRYEEAAGFLGVSIVVAILSLIVKRALFRSFEAVTEKRVFCTLLGVWCAYSSWTMNREIYRVKSWTDTISRIVTDYTSNPYSTDYTRYSGAFPSSDVLDRSGIALMRLIIGMAKVNTELRDAFDELKLEDFLATTILGNASNLRAALENTRTFDRRLEEVHQKHSELIAETTVEQREVSRLTSNAAAARKILEGFYQSLAASRVQTRESKALALAFSATMREIVQVLLDAQGHYSIDDGRILFTRDEDLNRFNALYAQFVKIAEDMDSQRSSQFERINRGVTKLGQGD